MFGAYFAWHYGRGFRALLEIERSFFDFGWYFFSISELARSLFAPWRRIAEQKRGNIFTGEWWWAWWGNAMSRGIGAIVRLMTIAVGFLFETALLLILACILVLWILAPPLIAAGYLFGILLFVR